MPEIFIGAGSNAGPERALRLAAAELERRFGEIRCSSVYCSAAVGARAADYSNAVIAIATRVAVAELRAALRAIEAAAGRTRTDPAVCELDLDLLVCGLRVAAMRPILNLPTGW